jgi:hypothetical protein
MNHKTRAAFSLALALLFCGFGRATELQPSGKLADCEAASAGCKKACGGISVYDPDREDYLKQSDFKARCEQSCTAGLDSCKGQNSNLSCKTSYYHCTGSCPWSVWDSYAQMKVSHTNSFQQCSGACMSGYNDCEAVRVKLPPRKRSASFSSCGEAQGACYAGCMGAAVVDSDHGAATEDSNFPDLCAEACAKGVPSCKAKSGALQCDSFSQSCAASCPQTTNNSGDNAPHAPSSLARCTYACQLGAGYCRALL